MKLQSLKFLQSIKFLIILPLIIGGCSNSVETKKVYDKHNRPLYISAGGNEIYSVSEWEFKEHTYIIISKTNGGGVRESKINGGGGVKESNRRACACSHLHGVPRELRHFQRGIHLPQQDLGVHTASGRHRAASPFHTITLLCLCISGLQALRTLYVHTTI